MKGVREFQEAARYRRTQRSSVVKLTVAFELYLEKVWRRERENLLRCFLRSVERNEKPS